MKNTKVIEKICKGQSLFEVLIAMAVIALIAVAIASLTIYSVRNNSASRNRSLANSYAQEGMEWLRKYRDENFTPFYSKSSVGGKKWCMDTLPDSGWLGGGGACGNNKFIVNSYPPNLFIREATLYTDGSNAVKTQVEVRWTDTQGVHRVQIINKFTNWQSQP